MPKGNPHPTGSKRSMLIRPGLTCKAVLSGSVPLIDGSIVTEASINDLHAVYSYLIDKENVIRPKNKQLKGMATHSWYMLFQFARLLKLVKLVREEPMKRDIGQEEGSTKKKHLYSVRRQKSTRIGAVISKRRIFTLTDEGKKDEVAWSNLSKAWKNRASFMPQTFADIGVTDVSGLVDLEKLSKLEEEYAEQQKMNEMLAAMEEAEEEERKLEKEQKRVEKEEAEAAEINKVIDKEEEEEEEKEEKEEADEEEEEEKEEKRIGEEEKGEEKGEEKAKAGQPKRGRGRPKKPADTSTQLEEEAKSSEVAQTSMTFKPFKWHHLPSKERIDALAIHFEALNKIGIQNDAVRREADRLTDFIGDWAVEISDMLDTAKSTARAQDRIRLERATKFINEAFYGLDEKDLPRAIENLKSLSAVWVDRK